jgi:serine/threonine protein kinase
MSNGFKIPLFLDQNANTIGRHNTNARVKPETQIQKQYLRISNGKFRNIECLVMKIDKNARGRLSLENLANFKKLYHENILRIFDFEDVPAGTSIYCEKYQLTYQDCINGIDGEIASPLTLDRIFKHTTKGLQYLHSKNIIHGDLNLRNIVIDVERSHAKIFHNLNIELKRFPAPEIVNSSPVEQSIKSDIFSLACIFTYGITGGNNLFDEDGAPDFACWNLSWRGYVAEALIREMIEDDPNGRPTCDRILQHLLVWNNLKVRTFFQTVKEFLAVTKREEIKKSNLEQC